MNDSSEHENEMVVDLASSRRLFTLGCCVLIGAVIIAWWQSPLADPLQLLAGIAILILGCVPSLMWAYHRHPWFPCFEISTLTSVVFYAIPLLGQYDELNAFPDTVMETSGFLVAGYLAAAIAGFVTVKNPRNAPRWAAVKLVPDGALRYLPAGLILNTVYIYADRFTTIIPHNFDGLVRALCFGIGTITAFILACEWGRDRLSSDAKVFFVVSVLIQVTLLFSHLYLISGMSLIILSVIGYTTTRRRVPWLPLVLCLPVIAVLHNGKSRMREAYWGPNTALPTVGELPEFFARWIQLGLQKNEFSDSSSLAGKLAERASLLQMLCMSVDQVPSVRPHLDGESYIDIPAQIVPRFLWADKPSSLMSNVRLAIYFNLVDPNNPFTTSIAFGVIAEAYINFGTFGVLILGALTGFGFKHIALRSIGLPLFSAVGIFMILLTAWSFQTELVMATWIASLFQASAICIGVPVAWKHFFGSR